jgi:hypothetical protein
MRHSRASSCCLQGTSAPAPPRASTQHIASRNPRRLPRGNPRRVSARTAHRNPRTRARSRGPAHPTPRIHTVLTSIATRAALVATIEARQHLREGPPRWRYNDAIMTRWAMVYQSNSSSVCSCVKSPLNGYAKDLVMLKIAHLYISIPLLRYIISTHSRNRGSSDHFYGGLFRILLLCRRNSATDAVK